MNNNKHKKEQLKGQILVIVLLVLSILGIFVVAVATNTRRDVIERIQNEQYEQYYSLTEKRMLQVVQQVQISSSIDGLEDVFGECEPGSGILNEYICEFADKPEDDSLDTALVRVTIQDDNNIEKLPVEKDQTFKISLDDGSARGYLGLVEMQWTGADVAWVITLDYRNPNTGEYKVIKDVYDKSGVYYQPVTTHAFTFNDLVQGSQTLPPSNNTGFRIDSVTGLPAGFEALSLRLKPIIESGELLTELSINGGTGFPPQVREIIGEGISNEESLTGDESPAAILEIQLPLHAAPAEILDYVLRSETTVTKPF
ncbi:MAG: hypothetical protein ACE5DX_00470 [Candidatus Dojkabacteria bacterium]